MSSAGRGDSLSVPGDRFSQFPQVAFLPYQRLEMAPTTFWLWVAFNHRNFGCHRSRPGGFGSPGDISLTLDVIRVEEEKGSNQINL